MIVLIARQAAGAENEAWLSPWLDFLNPRLSGPKEINIFLPPTQ
jgi:hypothetical protein